MKNSKMLLSNPSKADTVATAHKAREFHQDLTQSPNLKIMMIKGMKSPKFK